MTDLPATGATPMPTDHTERVTGPTQERSAPRCPRCGSARTATARYCENDGYDFVTGASSWTAIVSADAEHYHRVAPEGIAYPADYATRRFTLAAESTSIGRRSASRGIEPDIDLAGPVEDPAVSHLHAVIERGPDGGYSLVDPGSANGTTINDSTTPIPNGEPVPLRDGDRIHIGAWTTVIVAAPDAIAHGE